MKPGGVLLAVCLVLAVQAAEETNARPDGSRPPVQESRCNDVPSHPYDLVLSRPTSNSVLVSVLCYRDWNGYIAYGTEAGHLMQRTPDRAFAKGVPAEILLSGLEPDSRYVYELRLAGTNSPGFSFHTARPAGSTFKFTVTADSHLDEQTDPALCERALASASADAPDLHIDLGDTFMTEKHATREAAARQYLAQRWYFGQLCGSVPLFLVLGNHDGESPRGNGAGADDLAIWANQMRKRYFPNPMPDSFYTGNTHPHPQAGPLQDYYAWEWGDALFVVLDPFWFTQKQKGRSGNWMRSLGTGQYLWLKQTLENSRARFKLVFIHHLVGGADSQARGGAEAAPFYEWGGRNADGSDGFAQNRPGWAGPIHPLLVQNKVAIVFHGHDHLYARQELDGIVYQEVPQPGYPGRGKPPRSAPDYGYRSGKILGSPGYLRAQVSPERLKVEFASLAGQTATVAHSYDITPR